MKTFMLSCVCVFLMVSCKSQPNYYSFGDIITAEDVLSTNDFASEYNNLKVGDSVTVKAKAKVNSVCQAKGCWMRLDLEDGNEVMVKFKDYGFFMPKDIAGKEVIVNGNAFVTIVPVEELRHYAEDAGKSAEEIAAITEPKKTLSFQANGVLIPE